MYILRAIVELRRQPPLTPSDPPSFSSSIPPHPFLRSGFPESAGSAACSIIDACSGRTTDKRRWRRTCGAGRARCVARRVCGVRVAYLHSIFRRLFTCFPYTWLAWPVLCDTARSSRSAHAWLYILRFRWSNFHLLTCYLDLRVTLR